MKDASNSGGHGICSLQQYCALFRLIKKHTYISSCLHWWDEEHWSCSGNAEHSLSGKFKSIDRINAKHSSCVLVTISLLIWMYDCLDLDNLLEKMTSFGFKKTNKKTLILSVTSLQKSPWVTSHKTASKSQLSTVIFYSGQYMTYFTKHPTAAQVKNYILQSHLTTTQFLNSFLSEKKHLPNSFFLCWYCLGIAYD